MAGEATYAALLDTCKMMLRLVEGENLDEKFGGEATILRDVIARSDGISNDGDRICMRCEGLGWVLDPDEPEISEDAQIPCPNCEGSGYID